MACSVNGWNTIGRFLNKSGVRQNDLAQLLSVTPAAISNIKSGRHLLSPEQMDRIIHFLKFDENAVSDFYTELFNARISLGEVQENYSVVPRIQQREQLHDTVNYSEIPIAVPASLNGYEPSLGPLDRYLLNKLQSRYPEKRPEEGVCAIHIPQGSDDIPLRGGSMILISAHNYVRNGELCLVGDAAGRIMLREFSRRDEVVNFRNPFDSARSELPWNVGALPHKICWIFPVIEVIMKVRR